MTLNKIRSALYATAKILGDVQAANKASRTRSTKPIERRLARRFAGKLTGRFLGRLFR